MAKARGIDCICEVWDRAWDRYPEAWYEYISQFRHVLAVSLVALSWGQLWLHWLPPQWVSAAGLAAYVGGAIYDVYATTRTFRLRSEFDRREVEFPVQETNPFLPRHPTIRDQMWNWSIVLELLLLAAWFKFPAAAMGAALMHVCAGLNNLRLEKRMLWALQWLDGKAT